ncbi:MAG: hypothetical protein E3J69_04395 [Anaerolineales bacterium]|nr:MAG: hypothetical protein E3J69_04395 [Anaerolineales bacterium]
MVTLLTLPLPWSDVQPLLRRALEEVGLIAVQSFDLQSARGSLLDPELCPCPNHGTSHCTCQYIVYIVRQEGQPPISLEVHGYDDGTNVSLAPPSDGIIDESTMKLVRLAMDQLALVHDPPPP